MADNNAHKRLVRAAIAFLDSMNCHETARTLEKETGYFFNLAYFEHCFVSGLFEDAEDYLVSFLPAIYDNAFSANVYFEINWHKFVAVLDQDVDRAEARKIIDQDLRPFERYQPNLIVSASELASLDDFRMHEAFRGYGNLEDKRREMLGYMRTNLEANPLLEGKIQY